jgi:hypothetical protein
MEIVPNVHQISCKPKTRERFNVAPAFVLLMAIELENGSVRPAKPSR